MKGPGILQGAAQPQQQPQPQDSAEVDDDVDLTPEEQAIFDKHLRTALGLLYEKKPFEAVLQLLGAMKANITDNIARAVNMLLDKLEQKVGLIDEGILLGIAGELIEHLDDIATRAGIADLNEDQTGEALIRAVQYWMTQHPDRVEPNFAQELAASSGLSPEQLGVRNNG